MWGNKTIAQLKLFGSETIHVIFILYLVCTFCIVCFKNTISIKTIFFQSYLPVSKTSSSLTRDTRIADARRSFSCRYLSMFFESISALSTVPNIGRLSKKLSAFCLNSKLWFWSLLQEKTSLTSSLDLTQVKALGSPSKYSEEATI